MKYKLTVLSNNNIVEEILGDDVTNLIDYFEHHYQNTLYYFEIKFIGA